MYNIKLLILVAYCLFTKKNKLHKTTAPVDFSKQYIFYYFFFGGKLAEGEGVAILKYSA